jgi:flagellar protein FliS
VNRQNEYLLSRVQCATPMELIGILYDTAIQCTEEARAYLRSGDILSRGQAVNKAVEIIFELQRSLRHEVQPQYSQNLSALYRYMQSRLAEAHARKSEQIFEEVARLLRTLEEGWKGAMKLEAQPRENASETPAPPGPYFADTVSGSQESRSWSL